MTVGLLEAWKIYGDPKAAILFIIEDVTYNICDQRFHEFELKRLNSRVKVLRKTLTEINRAATLTEDNELVVYVFFLTQILQSNKVTIYHDVLNPYTEYLPF